VIILFASFKRSQMKFLVVSLALLAVLYFWIPSLDNRAGKIVRSFRDSPALVLADVSVSNRIGRAAAPVYEAVRSGLVPHRFPRDSDIPIAFGFISGLADTHVERLSSLATVLLYVFGWISLPLLVTYFFRSRAPFFVYAAIAYFSVTNISIATPYLFVLLAVPLLGTPVRILTQPSMKPIRSGQD
jgi:hypothetical protein